MRRFLLGGSGWPGADLPANVRAAGHVPTADHNVMNCSARLVLNIARDSMADTGFSPATRVFEAAGAGACVLSDAWEGIEMFLKPGEEILVARDAQDVVACVDGMRADDLAAIGAKARARVLADHTYQRRAEQVDALFAARSARQGQGPAARRAGARA